MIKVANPFNRKEEEFNTSAHNYCQCQCNTSSLHTGGYQTSRWNDNTYCGCACSDSGRNKQLNYKYSWQFIYT